jgi:two-component system cell cycle response regulator DivK
LRFSDRLSDIEHPKAVLIAEDDPAGLALFRRALTLCGLKILTANSGMSACAMIREHHPDIVLIDVQLPDISGLEIASWIKKEKALESIAVVVVSRSPMKSGQDHVYLDRCDAQIIKPISLDALLGTIWDLVDRPPGCGRIDTPTKMQRPAS